LKRIDEQSKQQASAYEHLLTNHSEAERRKKELLIQNKEHERENG
jgi:hypothetical protein